MNDSSTLHGSAASGGGRPAGLIEPEGPQPGVRSVWDGDSAVLSTQGKPFLLVFLAGALVPLLIFIHDIALAESVVNGLILSGSAAAALLALLKPPRPGIGRPAAAAVLALAASSVLCLAGATPYLLEALCRGLGCSFLVLTFARVSDGRRLRLITDSARFIQSLFASFSCSVFITDGEKLIRVNGRAAGTYRHAREGAPVVPLMKELGLPQEKHWIASTLMKGTQSPILIKDKCGRPVFEMSCYPLSDSTGSRKAGLVKISGVTEETLAGERIKVLSRVVDSVNDAVLTLDLEGRITDMNRIGLGLCGVELETALHRPFAEVLQLRDGDARRALAAALHDFMPLDLNASLAEGGEERQVLISLSTLCERDGSVIGFVIFVKDTTEMKKIEQRLIQVEKLNSLGSLVAGFAHELNNPLTSVLGCAQLLEGGLDDEDLLEHTRMISRHGTRCREIVTNLLKFARRQPPEKKRTDINKVALATFHLMDYQLRKDGVETVLDLRRGLSRIMADGAQLQHVLVNLMANAHHELKKISGEKRIVLSTHQSNNEILLRVANNGPGIPEEIINRIFEPFFTTKNAGEGTGLGLSLSFGIVEEHGGSLTARNLPGAGAVFEIALPVEESKPFTQNPSAGSAAEPVGCPSD